MAYNCLMSIPFHQEDALFFIETILAYVKYHADIPWLKDPPVEYASNVKEVRSLSPPL
jgi:hypothetical protein